MHISDSLSVKFTTFLAHTKQAFPVFIC